MLGKYRKPKADKLTPAVRNNPQNPSHIKHCDTFVDFEGKKIPQFLLADISGVVESIKRETGIEILGIISLPQMSMIGMNIDVNSGEVWLED